MTTGNDALDQGVILSLLQQGAGQSSLLPGFFHIINYLKYMLQRLLGLLYLAGQGVAALPRMKSVNRLR